MMQPQNEPEVDKGGRPEHEPSEESRGTVETMAGYGITEIDIAKVIAGGIAPKTLRKHYRTELDTGHIKANSLVIASLFRQATDLENPSTAAGIWWTKCRAGWKEVLDVKLSGDPDNRCVIEFVNANHSDTSKT